MRARLLHELLDWLHSRSQQDSQAVASATEGVRPTVGFILDQVEPSERDRLLCQLQELSCACEAWEVRFGDMLHFAKVVHDGGGRTWCECLYEAIVAVRDSGQPFRHSRLREMHELCREVERDARPQHGKVLDKPNAKFLPYKPR